MESILVALGGETLPLSLCERLTTSFIARRCQPASKIDQLPASNMTRVLAATGICRSSFHRRLESQRGLARQR
jgi:hypothetical protein